MNKPDVIAVIDSGKTNKKVLLFDAEYKVLNEETVTFPETNDEDGFPCEDIRLLKKYISETISQLSRNNDVNWKAINFSAYGASLVHIDENGRELTPLYNYLKPCPPHLQEELLRIYGGSDKFCTEVSSPMLGSLNSALQLLRLKREQPGIFDRIHFSLHLPQYLSWLVNNQPVSDLTSIGCHTLLWDFSKKAYHRWVSDEGISSKLAPLADSSRTFPVTLNGKTIQCGIGLHDSSAALIPYLVLDPARFILVSTGTWNITLNPFNSDPLTAAEIESGCLYYLSYSGNPVKAARLFAGRLHDKFCDRIAAHFNLKKGFYKNISFDPHLLSDCNAIPGEIPDPETFNPAIFNSVEEAYHFLVSVLVEQQLGCIRLVQNDNSINRIYVDGGFSRNEIFMRLLAERLPAYKIFAAEVPQATALGAALSIHDSWNPLPILNNLVKLTFFPHRQFEK
ncbi:FGGY-family carbohydrate kinase [Flavihumibacter solisilvae]|uniref:Carbohydrate kinase n=1 Tax=Flavihumibacter solisilvae TaxID=1349421 RepID=A0A0C1L9R6_9BACT|nr:FGGY family carbohydrate kinase [Flavihumibacter solisilvae]KIC96271.1 hypothetical protein OI18_00435 [Flavihumibacter solisilvae]